MLMKSVALVHKDMVGVSQINSGDWIDISKMAQQAVPSSCLLAEILKSKQKLSDPTSSKLWKIAKDIPYPTV